MAKFITIMNLARPHLFFVSALLALVICSPAVATEAASVPVVDVSVETTKLPTIDIPAQKPRMSADLALSTYEKKLSQQNQELGEYEDSTTIEAELPKTSQKGRFQLKRIFMAPKTMAFKAVDFVGDGFVKTNVIARLLQSEVDHVRNGESEATAIDSKNYKFSYKGYEVIEGRDVHAFQVKPRQKRSGLFKGKVYIDARTGLMVRAEGRMVKSPSVFIKNIEFVQDYAEVNGFNFVAHIHSKADTRVIGPAVVDITHSDYQPKSVAQAESVAEPTVVTPVSYNLR